MEVKGSGPSCSGLNLVAHPRAKSKVWKYFGFDSDADGCILHWKRIYCRVCLSPIAYSGNTSNLSYHLEKNHPAEFSDFVRTNADQVRETLALSRVKMEPAPPNGTRRQSDVTGAVVNFVAKGLHPASVVDEPTFRSLLATLDPGYVPPSGRDLTLNMLPQMYRRMRDAVFCEVAELETCGVTADLWRSRAHGRTYVSLSVHSLDHSASGFSMTSRCLKTLEVQEDNAAESVTRAVYQTFVDWGIAHRVMGATCGSVGVAKACSLLELSVEMPCLGHAINRALADAFRLPQVDGLLGRCRRVVEHFRGAEMFLLTQQQKPPGRGQCGLVLDCSTSWSSTLAMLRRLKEQQLAVTAALADASGCVHAPDWTLLEGLIGVLQPFDAVVKMMTSCRHPTISMVRPVLHMLLSGLQANEGDPKGISTTKEVISAVLSSTYSLDSAASPNISTFLNAAAFLDPRYKRLPFLSAQDRSRVESYIVEEAKAALEKHTERHGLQDLFVVSEEPPPKKATPPRERSASENPLAAIFCQTDGEQSPEELLHAQLVLELNNYKAQRVLGLDEDPLLWWSSHAALFPTLPKVLQKFWSLPATSAPCHRLFSSSGAVLCGKRDRIAPALVDQQVFLYENSRSSCEPEPCEEEEEDVLEVGCSPGGPLD